MVLFLDGPAVMGESTSDFRRLRDLVSNQD